MKGLADAVKNGPRARNAKVVDLEARIRLAEAKATKASQQAAAYRAKAKGDGPVAKYRKIQAAGMTDVANQRRGEANRLKVELAKLKADQAAKDAKHARRVGGSTADEFGTGPTSPDQRPGQVANPGPPAKPGGGQVANRPQEIPASKSSPTQPTQPKGHPMISGEAVDIEQTEANIAQIKTSVAEIRGALEGLSGSLASGGLNKLAGTFSAADDGLDSLSGPLSEAEKYLADQRGIAEAAQAAGEMHASSSFYGAATGAGAGPSAFPRTTNLRTVT